MTTVTSVRGIKPHDFLSDPMNCYVGRNCAGYPSSPFGNPFKVQSGTLNMRTPNQVVCRFAECLLKAIDGTLGPMPYAGQRARFLEMAKRLPELKGKRLGCWCCEWSPGQPIRDCHAACLAMLADGHHLSVEWDRVQAEMFGGIEQ